MQNFGIVFRKLRNNKKLTLKQVAGNSISYSNLAAFERGDHMISLETLTMILDKLNITLEEFISIIDLPRPKYSSLLNEANEAVMTNNQAMLLNLLAQTKDKADYANRCTYLMLKAIGSHQDASLKLTTEEIQFIIDYLWHCEVIGHYDLTIFGNCLTFLPTSNICIFSGEIIKKIARLKNGYKNTRDYIRTVQNAILELINREEFANATNLGNQLSAYLPESYFFEKFIAKFYENIIQFKQTNDSQYRKNCLALCQLLKELNVPFYETYFDGLVNEYLLES